MKKITKNDYWKFKKDFETAVANGALPGRKDQKQSKKRAVYYAKWAKKMNLHIETVRRAARSKNYQEYLRLGRENRGTSTKRKPNKNVENVFNEAYENLTKEVVKSWYPEPTPTKSKPKKYKTTIISTEYIPPFLPDEGIESYTVEVLND